jgi:DNA-binding NarL/FixJ family response regulator
MSRASGGQRRAAADTVAVIAPAERHVALAGVLSAAGYRSIASACVEEVAACVAGESLSAIVIWIDDPAVGVGGQIEPLRRSFPEIPVLLVSAKIERWDVRAALAAGVSSVVLEGDLAAALGPCLRAAAAGQVCVPRAHWRQVEPPVLSMREKQILGLVVMGYMNSQIAEQLFLAESTVKSHLSSAFGKLGVRSRNEAVELIINPQRGLGMGILGLGSEPLQPVASATT